MACALQSGGAQLAILFLRVSPVIALKKKAVLTSAQEEMVK